jgi:hypothetical protein
MSLATLNRPRLVIPATAIAARPLAYTTPRTINVLGDRFLSGRLGLLAGALGGSSALSGIHAVGDSVITTTSDGIDVNVLWAEFQAALALLNAQRQPLIDLLTYTVPKPVESVPQVGNAAKFEKSSEFGVPRAIRTDVDFFQMGFSFDDYDVGVRFTWKFLRDADAEQVRSVNAAILEADNRLIFEEVMRSLYRNTNRTAEIQGAINNQATVYSAYNGTDGVVPPTYRTNTFVSTHTHYLTSGATVVDSGDLDDAMTQLEHHGYNASNGYTEILCVNPVEGDVIRQFRSIANGGTAKYDFIPAQGTPTFLLPITLRVNDQGAGQPQDTYRGMTVLGRYGNFLILQDDYFPAGYLTAFATGGRENIQNPIGIREHARAEFRGLVLLKGRDPNYPLQESYYGRSFGTGIRHRGALVIIQLKVAAGYVPPTQYT